MEVKLRYIEVYFKLCVDNGMLYENTKTFSFAYEIGDKIILARSAAFSIEGYKIQSESKFIE